MPKLSLHVRIFIGMGVGLILGLALMGTDPENARFQSVIWWLDLLGKDLFVGALKMIIAPLIFASIVAGICSLPDSKALGNIGWRTFGYYVVTTAIAVAIGLVAVLLIRPGFKPGSETIRKNRTAEIKKLAREYDDLIFRSSEIQKDKIPSFREWVVVREGTDLAETQSRWSNIARTKERGPGEMFRQDIVKPILSNPFASLADNRSLGIICFAILTGLACMSLGERARPVSDFFKSMNAVMMKITLWVMEIAPLAIGCIIASILATLGVDALKLLGWYCITVITGIAIHVVVLLLIVRTIGGMPIRTFLSGIRNAWLIAFATTSSAATLPVTMECVSSKLKVSKKVSNFSLPVGATMNMDGTALYEGVAVIFLIQLFGGMDDVGMGQQLPMMQLFIIFITAVLASVGAAAVPSAGLVTMALVASAVGLPLHYIVFLFAVDHLLDMFRTSTNVLGDAAGAVVVDKLTGFSGKKE